MRKRALAFKRTYKVIRVKEANKGIREILIDKSNITEQSYMAIINRRKKAFDRLAD